MYILFSSHEAEYAEYLWFQSLAFVLPLYVLAIEVMHYICEYKNEPWIFSGKGQIKRIHRCQTFQNTFKMALGGYW